MFGFGFFELTLFGIIALIVLGPEKLPVAARTLGRWYGMFRRASTRLQTEISHELNFLEVQEELKQELAKIRESEAQMKSQMADLQRSLNRGGDKLRDDIQDATKINRTKRQAGTEDDSHTADHTDSSTDTNVPNHDRSSTHEAPKAAFNLPLTNRWFRLSDYDRRRRLPHAPLLPNYTADPLLHTLTNSK